jgi:hypothetical protein
MCTTIPPVSGAGNAPEEGATGGCREGDLDYKRLILRLGLLGEDLAKGMNFNPFEDAVNRIGIFPGELLGFFE